MRQILVVIPARGGSKRIPQKNTLLLRGKPLLNYSIEQAKQSVCVSRVIVSTDDKNIASVAESAGAEVVMRPSSLANDTAASETAILHVLDQLMICENYVPDSVVFLQATSPLRMPNDIDAAVEYFYESGADALFSVCRFDKYIWQIEGDHVKPINYDYMRRWREQEFPVQYQENGSIYVFRPELIRETGNRLGGKIVVYEMDFLDSFQVDRPEDLALIEMLLARKRTLT